MGSEFQVNTHTADLQSNPDVAMGESGFVVTWTSYEQDGWGAGVYGQRYDASGAPLGGEFRVHTATLGHQHSSSVGVDADGGFVVAWQADLGTKRGIFGRQFAASASPIGADFEVYQENDDSTPPTNPDLAHTGKKGDFVVVWQDGTKTISGRRFKP